jgi:hypothetical protein
LTDIYVRGAQRVIPLVAFYDIHGRKREMLDTIRDQPNETTNTSCKPTNYLFNSKKHLFTKLGHGKAFTDLAYSLHGVIFKGGAISTAPPSD